ncbi:hypothetical protein PWY87_03530 [Kribbella solani]|uniref:hypothetical protein n=1 Tax=Kribbella solani TaxID=236067 RepID=UPI0029A59EF6|nr:hypothetical protein [Kribbella solani]MDX2968363.1 hypothetical protein [Kribbella solani]MDX3000730.1 hypothetical protein [Kribbella solani]
MPTRRLIGPEILPGTREYQWVARVVAAVERRTGLASSWNRRLYEELITGATAEENGPMTINRSVLEPVMEVYGELRPPGDWEAFAARSAVLTVVHETDHHQHRNGDQNAPDAISFGSMEFEPLIEGLAEVNRKRILDDIIDDIGLDKLVPQIHQVRALSHYAGYEAGVEHVLDGLHRISERPLEEVHAAVDSASFVQRYNAMADVVIDSRLDGLMPAEHRSQIRLVLAQPLREGLGSLSEYDLIQVVPAVLAERGHETGAKAVERLEQEVQAVEQHYRRYGDHAPRMPMNTQEVALLQRIESYYGRSTAGLEVSRLRELLDDERGARWSRAEGWHTPKQRSWAGAPVSDRNRALRRPRPPDQAAR